MAEAAVKTYVLDTNVLLRFLVGDNLRQRHQAERWFREAEAGKRRIVVVPLVIAEACFVLETFYKKDRGDIADALENVVSQPWLSVEARETLLGLWPWYRKNFHFVDSFLCTWAQQCDATVLTFDQHLARIKAPRTPE